MKTNKYPQLNILTFRAIIMIFTIHYFNYFASGSNFITSNTIISILTGFALIAVPIFVANIAYTHLYLEKSVSYLSYNIYLIIIKILQYHHNKYSN